MTVNALRGEVTITLGPEEYGLRPSFDAMTAWEEKTGRSTLQLAIAADAGKLLTKDMAAIVLEAITAWGHSTGKPQLTEGWKIGRIAELLFDAGLMAVQPRVSLLLTQALTGGHKPGEAVAGETSPMMTTTGTPAVN